MQFSITISGCGTCCNCACDEPQGPRGDNDICAPLDDAPSGFSFDLFLDPAIFSQLNPNGHWCLSNEAPNTWLAVRQDGFAPGTDLKATLTGTRNAAPIGGGFYLTWRLEFMAGGVLLAAYNSSPGFAGSDGSAQNGIVCNVGFAADLQPGKDGKNPAGWPARIIVSPTCCGVLPRPCPDPPADFEPFNTSLLLAILNYFDPPLDFGNFIPAAGLYGLAYNPKPFFPFSTLFTHEGSTYLSCNGLPVGPLPPSLAPFVSGQPSGADIAISTFDSQGVLRRADYEATISFYGGGFGAPIFPDGKSPLVLGTGSFGPAAHWPSYAVLYQNLCAPTFHGAVPNRDFPNAGGFGLAGTDGCPFPFNQAIALGRVTPQAQVWQSDLVGVVDSAGRFIFRGDLVFYAMVDDGSGPVHQVMFNRANANTLYRAPAGQRPGLPFTLSLFKVAWGANWPNTLTLQP